MLRALHFAAAAAQGADVSLQALARALTPGRLQPCGGRWRGRRPDHGRNEHRSAYTISHCAVVIHLQLSERVISPIGVWPLNRDDRCRPAAPFR
jgi:hypothetical protein